MPLLSHPWLPARTYYRNLVFEDSFFEIWRINVFFVHKNPLYMLESYFSCLENAKLCPKKENITLTLRGSASVQGCWLNLEIKTPKI
jgi:hypothetical protein